MRSRVAPENYGAKKPLAEVNALLSVTSNRKQRKTSLERPATIRLRTGFQAERNNRFETVNAHEMHTERKKANVHHHHHHQIAPLCLLSCGCRRGLPGGRPRKRSSVAPCTWQKRGETSVSASADMRRRKHRSMMVETEPSIHRWAKPASHETTRREKNEKRPRRAVVVGSPSWDDPSPTTALCTTSHPSVSQRGEETLTMPSFLCELQKRVLFSPGILKLG